MLPQHILCRRRYTRLQPSRAHTCLYTPWGIGRRPDA